MSHNHKDKVVSKTEVVRLLQLWESKGHGVMSVVRIFTCSGLQSKTAVLAFSAFFGSD
ncbi:hypothetical protein RYA07_26900 [Pseudomonas syringae pv. actinidiae]|nr:hypothetical protein [Pseudomonas syringae pv. actinidiae]